MSVDSAFELKTLANQGKIFTYSDALEYLEQSALVAKLEADFEYDVLNVMNRLIQVLEIPFAIELPKSKLLLEYLLEKSACGDGFSYTGKPDNILSCYNAMICSVLIKAGYNDLPELYKGIRWIIEHQGFERNFQTKWQGSSSKKYGACLKRTPCYIGVVKSVIALSDYVASGKCDTDITAKLNQGLEYILSHHLYQKQTDSSPIRDYMIKLTYPFSYRTNILELLALMKKQEKLSDNRCRAALDYILKKRKKSGYWHANSGYNPKHWVTFDLPNKPGLWITHFIEQEVL